MRGGQWGARHGALKYRLAPSQGLPEGIKNMTPEQRQRAKQKQELSRDSGRADQKLRKF